MVFLLPGVVAVTCGGAVAAAAGGIIHNGWSVEEALKSFAANQGRGLDYLSRHFEKRRSV